MRAPTVVLATRSRYLLLLTGAVLSLFAVHGRWDLPVAAWGYAIPLVAFARASRVRTAVLAAWGVAALDLAWFLVQAEVGEPVLVLLAAVTAAPLALPLVLDRLLAGRLPGLALGTLAYPLTRVAVEFGLTRLSPLGGVYGLLGTTQAGDLPLVQVASLTGVYGVSFLVAWLAPVAVAAWASRADPRRARYAVGAYAAVLTVVLAGGALRLVAFPPDAGTMRVAAVSASRAAWQRTADGLRPYDSVAAMNRARPGALRAAFRPAMDDLLASTAREAGAGARIVVWPESAVLTMTADEPGVLRRIRGTARRHRVYVQAGLTVYTRTAPYVENLAVLAGPDGALRWRYVKSHPVPVLEPYAPGPGVLPAATAGRTRLSTAICYDTDFPALLRQAGADGADVVFAPSNNWAGIARLHAENASFRAVENGFTLVRPASHGLTVVVDGQGRTLAASDWYRTPRQVAVASVPERGLRTVYARVGDLFAWTCLLGLLGLVASAVLAGAAARRSRKEGQASCR